MDLLRLTGDRNGVVRSIRVCLLLFGLVLLGAPIAGDTLSVSWKWDPAIAAMGIGAGAVSSLSLMNMPPADLASQDKDRIPEYDRWAIRFYSPSISLASDVSAAAMSAAPVVVGLYDRAIGNSDFAGFAADVLIYTEAMAYSVALNQFVRSMRMHPRPFVFNDQAPMKDRLQGEAAGSFYSGHATAAFLSAVYLSYTYPIRHPEFQGQAWLWTGSLASATVVSSLRVLSGKHYLSDVIAGAVMGSLFGFVVPWMHIRYNPSGTSRSKLPLIRVCGVGWDATAEVPTLQFAF